VRLKGGDPFVFGRGGEEALALTEAGIRFEIVPGVSAAVAAPAYAGVPVTHRGVASAVTFVTGHEDPTKAESAIDWENLARSNATLVILMGLGNLRAIVARLTAAGRAPPTRVALVRNGTCDNQVTLVGTLATIVMLAEMAALKPPAVIIVGAVVKLRERLPGSARIAAGHRPRPPPRRP
jgi:uroporphyrinogen III methyltransferase/synthase